MRHANKLLVLIAAIATPSLAIAGEQPTTRPTQVVTYYGYGHDAGVPLNDMSPRTTDVGAASRQFGEPNPDATPEPFTEIDKPVFTVPGVYGNYIKPRYRNYNRALSPNYVRPQSNNFDDGSGMSGAPMRSNNTPAGGTNKASGGNYMKPQR